ncbi:MAG: nitroreductase family protein [Nitrososphaerales archaeon]
MPLKKEELDTFECIRKKREVRSYRSESIRDDIIIKILEAGRLAGSAMNKQPWHFILVKDGKRLKDLGALCYTGSFIADANCAIVVLSDSKNPYRQFDSARAIQNMMLAACNEGVGSGITTGIDREKVKKMLKIPQAWEIEAVIALGYPDRGPMGKKNRKPLREITSLEEFGKPLLH